MWKRTAAAVVAALALSSRALPEDPGSAQPVPGPLPLEEALPQKTMPQPAGQQPIAPVQLQPMGFSGTTACDCASQPACWWVSADYMVGWIRGTNPPPLVTTSPAGTPMTSAGVLGLPTTTVLFGTHDVDDGARSGFRVGIGGWLDVDRTFGIDAGFFMLGSVNSTFNASSPDGSTILARPFLDVSSSLQTALPVSYPGVASGSVTASVRVNDFYSLNIDFQEAFFTDGHFRVESVLGYRFLRYNDELTVDQSTTIISAPLSTPGTQAVLVDRFSAENSFNGGEVGLRMQYDNDTWTVDAVGKIAAGNIHRSVGIVGTTTTTVPGGTPTTASGGLLALSSNINTFNTNDWGFVPEADFTVGWRVTSNIQLRLGYSFIYWSEIARANNQVNTNINSTLIPPPTTLVGPASPTFQLQKSDIWIQSINAGLELRF